MSKTRLKAAILVVSTTAAKDASKDASDSALRGIFENEGGGNWDVVETKIVTDDVLQIQKQVMQWTDGPEPVHFILTTGGTGFAVADYTPEAISPLLHKTAPGLVHGMLSASLAVTPCKISVVHRLQNFETDQRSRHDVKAGRWREKQNGNSHIARISKRGEGKPPGYHQDAASCVSAGRRSGLACPAFWRRQET